MTITPKILHKNVARISAEWIDRVRDEQFGREISAYAEQLTELLSERSVLIDQRAICNAEIGRTRKAGDNVRELIERVKKISADIKNLDSTVEETTTKLLQMQPRSLEDTVEPGMPGQFLPHSFSIHQANRSVAISDCTNADDWDTYIAEHPRSTHYHQYKWRALIDRNFGHTSYYLTARNTEGHITGVLSVVHMQSRLFGSFLLSMPWLIYGGAVADDEASYKALGDYVVQLMGVRDCSHVDLREVHPRSGWSDMPGKVAMVLSLPETCEQFNRELGSKLRAQIKRATREMPQIEFGGIALISEFYAVFAEKMRDLGTPVYHEGFFTDVATEFPDSTTFVVVRIAGKPVAAACLIGFREILEIPWAASRKSYNSIGINMFMYHAILEEAIARRYRFFDFGRSTEGESTYRFKAQWGARPYPLHWQRYLKNGVPFEGDGKPNIVMQTASRIWKRLPVVLATRMGPVIARNLPW